MSSILKALKKLEEEKTDKKEGAVNIARDILRTSRKAKKVENWILPTAVVALLLTGGMIAYFFAGGFSPTPGEPETAQVATSESVSETAAEDAPPKNQTAGTNKDEMSAAEASAGSGVKERGDAAAAVDRPEAVFAGPQKGDGPEVANAAATSSVAKEADSVEQTARTQKETAAALKDTAKALKETAEALKEKVVFPKEVTVVSSGSSGVTQSEKSQLEPSGRTGSKDAPKPEPVQTARMPEATVKAVDEDTLAKRVSENIYRPAKVGKSAPQVSKKEDEDTLPRVMTLGTESEKSKWMGTVNASGFPDLTVSEIHYQWDVKNRLAVVNDLPVMEGTLIEGARVDRILKDRVRFIYDGKYKEIRVRN